MSDICCTCHRAPADEEGRLAFEIGIAEQAMAAGDFAHARHHVAGALGLAPTDPRSLAVFEALAARADLREIPRETWYGNAAVGAFASFRAGERDRAVEVLADVTAVVPHLGYEHALTSWIASTDAPLSEGAMQRVARLLVQVGENTIGLHRLQPGERALLESHATLAEAFAAVKPKDLFLTVVSGLVRRVGRIDEARAIAAAIPGALGRIQEGLALRAAGDGRGAMAAFEEAARLDPDDAYAVERARCAWVAGDPDAALTLLADVPDDDPEVAGLRLLCRARPPGDPVDHLDAIRRAQRPDASSAPPDATVNVFKDPRVRGAKGLQAKVNGWQSPTNRLVMAVNEGHTDVAGMKYTMVFEDPERSVMAQVRGGPSAWVEREGVVVQAFAAPPEDVRRALVDASRGVEDLDTLFERGARIEGFAALQIVAAMLHPPGDLPGDALPDAVFRYQVAGAFAIAALPAREALRWLEALAFGPVDWVGAAAVLALGEIAHRSPGAAAEARRLLLAVGPDLLPFSTEPRFWALARSVSMLPGVPRGTTELLETWWRENWAPVEEHARARAAAASPPVPAPPPAAAAPGPAAGSGGALVVGLVVIGIVAIVMALVMGV